MSVHATLALAIAAAALASCSDDGQRARIELSLDTTSIDSQCESASCSDYPMSCGATVMVRVTDPDSGELITDAIGAPILQCISIASKENLCGLRDEQSRLGMTLPSDNVRVEVGVWNPDKLSVEDCNTLASSTDPFALFDLLGRPQTTLEVQPAFAGAAYFQVSEGGRLRIPLSCANPHELDIASCSANLTEVFARVTDLSSMQFLQPAQAERVSVEVGSPQNISENPNESIYELSGTSELFLSTASGQARYEALLQESFDAPIVCTSVLEDAAQATAAVSCENIVSGASILDLDANFISRDVVAAVLAALGEENFPEEGLVIGRVVSFELSPLADVKVSTCDPTRAPAQCPAGSVFYLSEDLSSLSTEKSSGSGFFVSRDVPYPSTWSASHPDGRKQVGTPVGGLIRGKVTAVLIRMTGEVIDP